ncbi:MAG: 3-deoxy-D-manno-octulosonic acid transferase [Salinarimonadaceae bacterium]|nr:MAG: 3-deoxy-D-manno-octulosonic acid transferase [Salinarimonadaceae bacterium]
MRRRLPLLLHLYRYAMAALEPVAAGVLLMRRRKGKEDPRRMSERRGVPGEDRPEGHLAWLHGASIGETMSILPLIERLARRGVTVLVTSGTVTSAEIIAQRLPPGAIHQFVPVDVPRFMSRFLDYWRPDIALFAESEIWPNAILALEKRDVPLILINGRLSERSYRRWSKVPGVVEALLSRFSLCLAQSAGDAERLQRLGAPRVGVAGNLKFDSPPPPADPRLVAALQGMVAGRPVWVAASTHPGEEEMVVAIHRALARRYANLLTIVAPRHPRRGEVIAEIAQDSALRTARRSLGEQPSREIDFYVADTVGELGLFYRLAPLVFVGGSLVPRGGQNPIEPAKLGAAILHGPHVQNFSEVYAALDRAGGALPVADAKTLAAVLEDLISDTALTREMARAGHDAVSELGGALDRTLRAVEPFVLGAKMDRR